MENNVALRKESVDRNNQRYRIHTGRQRVALRKESVDRNLSTMLLGRFPTVALRKESVDRNVIRRTYTTVRRGRSPQGERG